MNLTDPIFTNEEAARAHLEAIQWANGRPCPHCGTMDNSVLLAGASTRPGVYKCRDCRKPFSVTVGTVFERSHIPLHKWLLAFRLMAASKKGMSAHQLGRMLGLTYKSAWFMAHRIREAMTPTGHAPMGSGGGAVEVDETYIGKKETVKKSRMAMRNMNTVVSLVDRSTGRSRSIVVPETMSAAKAWEILSVNVARDAHLMTDQAQYYVTPGKEFASHKSVNHAQDEYVRRDGGPHVITTNQIEGFFGIFKRGMKGVYQHCGEQHLHRYLAEFDFRYSNRSGLGIDDTARADEALRGIVGKRLTYRRTSEAAHA
jgi:transposase-like protein